uniref:DUF7830 domain-containing protein n=1 Tax=Vibrio pomeroyi TaxID=198832 RepID=UPI00403E0601
MANITDANYCNRRVSIDEALELISKRRAIKPLFICIGCKQLLRPVRKTPTAHAHFSHYRGSGVCTYNTPQNNNLLGS